MQQRAWRDFAGMHSHVRKIQESNQLAYLNRVVRNNKSVDKRDQADFVVGSMASIRAACNEYAYIVYRIAKF